MENLYSLVKKIFYPLIACLSLGVSGFAYSETVQLYQNDFESPNTLPIRSCYALDGRSVNTLYGQPGALFDQINTVETVLINATGGSPNYSDPLGTGGNFAIGMLGILGNDKLSLTFDSQNLGFINIGMDISSIDVQGCGGPFGIAAPKYVISLLDSPGGVFNFANPVLDQKEIIGVAGPDQWTFDWTSHVVALDSSQSTDGNVSIVWDLMQSGYAAFDNLIITASTDPGDLGDGDGVCVYQEVTPGQEDFELLGEVDIFDLSAITAVNAFAYGQTFASSYSGDTPASITETSQLAPWRTSEGLVLGIIHDQPDDGTGGNVSFSFDLTGDIADALMSDDAGEMNATGGTWSWIGCCTDGGVLGTLDGAWSLIIDPDFTSGIDTWQVTGDGGSIELDMSQRVKLELCEPELPLGKEIIKGPDRDTDEQIDSVIEVKQGAATEYTWKISYNGPEEVAVLIKDTAPAESIVEMVNGEPIGLPCGGAKIFSDDSGEISVWRGGKFGRTCHSSTRFAWYPDSNEEMLTVDVSMRKSPGRGHKSPAFAPTSCGALYLNNGAVAWELDPATGEPVLNSETGDPEPPLFESNQLCVAAVRSDLLPGDGFGPEDDHDGDGIASYAEACTNEVRTDPCQTDTDGDGVDDGVDECPLEGLPGIGETLVNGCITPLPQ